MLYIDIGELVPKHMRQPHLVQRIIHKVNKSILDARLQYDRIDVLDLHLIDHESQDLFLKLLFTNKFVQKVFVEEKESVNYPVKLIETMKKYNTAFAKDVR